MQARRASFKYDDFKNFPGGELSELLSVSLRVDDVEFTSEDAEFILDKLNQHANTLSNFSISFHDCVITQPAAIFRLVDELNQQNMSHIEKAMSGQFHLSLSNPVFGQNGNYFNEFAEALTKSIGRGKFLVLGLSGHNAIITDEDYLAFAESMKANTSVCMFEPDCHLFHSTNPEIQQALKLIFLCANRNYFMLKHPRFQMKSCN